MRIQMDIDFLPKELDGLCKIIDQYKDEDLSLNCDFKSGGCYAKILIERIPPSANNQLSAK